MLTRAQLLMGNSSQGVVLAGQTQGVRQGVGVIIAADGTISFDSTTATGVLKTNNPTAYNAYVWPTTLGAVGQQLQLGAAGALSWEDPDQIPWTAKGQLIAGTGVGTSTILNVGVDGSILIADSTQASGLGYTTNFVATTGATSAANIPAGPVGSRPGSPIQGQLRFSTTSGEMEFWDGTSWQTIAGSATGLFVDKTANNGSAVIPAGTQAQRDSSPGAGYFRYDSTLNAMEFFDGTIWQVVVASASGNIFATLAQAQAGTIATLAATPETAVPKDASGMNGSAYIPAGTTAQRPAAGNYTGQFRYNTTIPQLEYSDGAAWQPVGASLSPASLAEAQAGTITTKYSSPQTAVPKDASGMTGSAYLPAGTTLQRPTAGNYTGQFRYNTTIPQLEYSDGTTWLGLGGLAAATLVQAQAGTLATVAATPQTAVPKDASGMTGSAYLPAGTTAQRPVATAYTGQFRYNTTVPQLEYSDGTTWIALGGLGAATLAQAQAGTLTSVAATPQTAVPKDASGMTGAAIIPSGTTAQRPGTPANGWLRFNSDITNNVEVYDAGTPGWRPLAYAQAQTVYPDLNVPAATTVTLPASLNVYNNVTIAGTLNITNASQIRAVGDVVITGTLSGAATGIPGATGIQLSSAGVTFPGYQGRNIGGGAYSGATTLAELNNGYVWTASLLGSSGGSGGITTGGGGGNGVSGIGGACGASLLIEAEGSIVFSGTCDFSGQKPPQGFAQLGASCGGGGGGSGGAFVLISNTSINLGGTINVSGGEGGDANNAGPTAPGGGGGGGGWVVVQSPSNTVTAAINKAGGGDGAGPINVAFNVLGGNGGSFAGAGGQIGYTGYGTVSQTGQPGYLSNNGVLS